MSASVHHPAAGPMKRTTIHNTTNPPIPIQAPRVVRATNCWDWLRVNGSQETIRSLSLGLGLRCLGGSPWMLRRRASPIEAG